MVRHARNRLTLRTIAVGLLWLSTAIPISARAQSTLSADALVSGIVAVRIQVNPDGRTVQTLGRSREGTGILIDKSGLILTIGYLMVEAKEAQIETSEGRVLSTEIVGYDYDTGFGLLRAKGMADARPLAIGRAADLKPGDKVLVGRAGGIDGLGAVTVASKRVFAGYWEYLLEEAVFTTPPFPNWSGAALIDRDGKLVGVGSLVVGDASGVGAGPPGNMFVPIDLLPPILGELIADGKVSGTPKPWIGVTTEEGSGRLVVRNVTPGGPAEKAGLERGDVVTGIGETTLTTLPDFYRRLWSLGPAGVAVPLQIQRRGSPQTLDVKSIDRLKLLKLDSTF